MTTTKTSPANLTPGMQFRTVGYWETSDGRLSALCGSIKKSAPTYTVESVEFIGGQRGHWTTYNVKVTGLDRPIEFSNKQKVEVTV